MPYKVEIVTSVNKKTGRIEQDSFSVGRSTTNDLIIQDPKISRKHLAVHLNEGRIFIQDSKSTCGSFIGEKQISSEQAMEYPANQLIKLGNSDYSIKLEYITQGFEEDTENSIKIVRGGGDDIHPASESEEGSAEDEVEKMLIDLSEFDDLPVISLGRKKRAKKKDESEEEDMSMVGGGMVFDFEEEEESNEFALKVTVGRKQTIVEPVIDGVVLGTLPSCHLVVDYKHITERHMTFFPHPDGGLAVCVHVDGEVAPKYLEKTLESGSLYILSAKDSLKLGRVNIKILSMDEYYLEASSIEQLKEQKAKAKEREEHEEALAEEKKKQEEIEEKRKEKQEEEESRKERKRLFWHSLLLKVPFLRWFVKAEEDEEEEEFEEEIEETTEEEGEEKAEADAEGDDEEEEEDDTEEKVSILIRILRKIPIISRFFPEDEEEEEEFEEEEEEEETEEKTEEKASRLKRLLRKIPLVSRFLKTDDEDDEDEEETESESESDTDAETDADTENDDEIDEEFEDDEQEVAGVVPRIVAMVIDVGISLLIYRSLPWQSWLETFGVKFSSLNEYIVSFLPAGLTICLWQLISVLVLGVTAGQFLTGIRGDRSFILNRAIGSIRLLLGYILLPLLFLDLRVIKGKQTIKEVLTRSPLLSSGNKIVSILLALLIFGGSLAANYWIGMNFLDQDSRLRLTIERKRHLVFSGKEDKTAREVHYKSKLLQFKSKTVLESNILILPALKANKRALQMVDTVSGEELTLSAGSGFSFAEILDDAALFNPVFPFRFPNLYSYSQKQKYDQNMLFMELEELLIASVNGSMEVWQDFIPSYGPFVMAYKKFGSTFLASVGYQHKKAKIVKVELVQFVKQGFLKLVYSYQIAKKKKQFIHVLVPLTLEKSKLLIVKHNSLSKENALLPALYGKLLSNARWFWQGENIFLFPKLKTGDEKELSEKLSVMHIADYFGIKSLPLIQEQALYDYIVLHLKELVNLSMQNPTAGLEVIIKNLIKSYLDSLEISDNDSMERIEVKEKFINSLQKTMQSLTGYRGEITES